MEAAQNGQWDVVKLLVEHGADDVKGYEGEVYTIDARKISMEALGKYFPNSPMLAAIVKVTGVMEEEDFLESMRKSYNHKFASRPEVIEGNMKALFLALEEVQ